jgi:hypothetical protein
MKLNRQLGWRYGWEPLACHARDNQMESALRADDCLPGTSGAGGVEKNQLPMRKEIDFIVAHSRQHSLGQYYGDTTYSGCVKKQKIRHSFRIAHLP